FMGGRRRRAPRVRRRDASGERVHDVSRGVRLGCVAAGAGSRCVGSGRGGRCVARDRRAPGAGLVTRSKLVALGLATIIGVAACSAGTSVVARTISAGVNGPAPSASPGQILSRKGLGHLKYGNTPAFSGGGNAMCATNS